MNMKSITRKRKTERKNIKLENCAFVPKQLQVLQNSRVLIRMAEIAFRVIRNEKFVKHERHSSL
jgi:hypothetical protein